MISIITRTKDRPILLKRAEQSILNQTWQGFQWIVVNDGGSPVRVNAHKLIEYPVSKGMEAASNIGLAVADRKYIVIHDDDDSWHPKFLETMLNALEGHKGACCQMEWVDETITGENIVTRKRRPFNPWLRGMLSYWSVCAVNPIAPISFVYERSVHDEIGLYDESLPVLGDWDFLLRFMAKYDIFVVPEVLAYYHHRTGDKGTSYASTVVQGRHKHQYYDTLLRNRFLRQGNPVPNLAQDSQFLVSRVHRLQNIKYVSWIARLLCS